jgi:septal ring factor EnvC (AmiA/AmiB activator)
MERNRWETAIRCLEVALHPNTGDDEVVAAVHGFRRIVAGWTLREVCADLTGLRAAHTAAATAEETPLRRENRELRGKLAAAEQRQADMAEDLAEARRQLGEWRDEARHARDEAAAGARQFAEFRAAHAQLAERLTRENADLRRMLDDARRSPAKPAPGPARPTFGSELAAALRGADSRPPTERGRAGAASATGRSAPRPAWIA